MSVELRLRWITDSTELPLELFDALVTCWARVSNAGGAVGFPFLPVSDATVREVAAQMRESLNTHYRLLLATVNDDLAGWLELRHNTSPLTRHWGSVARVQTDLAWRGRGVGAALMTEVARAAAVDGLERLHIEVRGGQGLEEFYVRLGWEVVGRWPGCLRLAPGDDRDEVLMVLHLDPRQV